MAVILAEQKIGPFYMSDLGLWCYDIQFTGYTPTVGEEFVVLWNGEEWPVVAQDASAFLPGFAALGNVSFYPGLSGNNEPFCIGWSCENGYMSVFALEYTEGDEYMFGVSSVTNEGGGDVGGSMNVRLKDRDGKPVDYSGVTAVQLATPDGGVQQFVAGEIVTKEVEPNFAGGNFEVKAGTGEFMSKVTVLKPETLMPDFIMEGVNIAGVIGTLVGGGGVKILSGSIDAETSTDITIQHNFGVVPDLVLYVADSRKKPSSGYYTIFSLGMSAPMYSLFPTYNKCTTIVMNTSEVAVFNNYSTTIESTSLFGIYGATESVVKIRANSSFKYLPGKWVVIGGLTQ